MTLDESLSKLNREIGELSAPVSSILIPGSRIFIVGEAPGQEEVRHNKPFVGAAGRELRTMLREAGIDFNLCSVSNVFSRRPPNNDEEFFCVHKSALPTGYSLPPLDSKRHLYVSPRYLPEIDRLEQEINEVKPNVILALGKTALWAVGKRTDLDSVRGVTLPSRFAAQTKFLCSFHPARILRDWSRRVVGLADFSKLARESRSPALRYDRTEIWINPILEDLRNFERRYFSKQRPIACDIETFGGLIRCVGFAPSSSAAIVVPFYAPTGPYWSCQAEEAEAWAWVKHALQTYKIIFHNGSYDTSYFLRFGIVPTGYEHDTLLLHHSLYPEMKKSLEFLGSYLANRPHWKKMRPRGNKTGKREE